MNQFEAQAFAASQVMQAWATIVSADYGNLGPFMRGECEIEDVPFAERFAIGSLYRAHKNGHPVNKVKLLDKQKSLDSMARALNMFVPDVQTTVEDQRRYAVMVPHTIPDIALWHQKAQDVIAASAERRDD